MAKACERLEILLKVHGDSYRSAAELCGVDHTTIMRVERGDTENPATLAKIAESYGVPLAWMKGEKDLAVDFAMGVLAKPLQERIAFLCEREGRLVYALRFLRGYAPETHTAQRLAEWLGIPATEVDGILSGEEEPTAEVDLDSLCAHTGLPRAWFYTGLVGREDEDELLVGLNTLALRQLAEAVGVRLTDDELHQAAVALV